MTRIWINRVFGLLLIAGFSYITYIFVAGGSNMRAFCEAIQVGELAGIILARAEGLGYSNRELENGQVLIMDSRAMGRFICDVSISDGKIVGATYVHND